MAEVALRPVIGFQLFDFSNNTLVWRGMIADGFTHEYTIKVRLAYFFRTGRDVTLQVLS